MLTLGFDDGASIEFKFMLSADTLFLVGEESGLAVTLKRLPPDEAARLAATPVPEPIATAVPESVPVSQNLADRGRAGGRRTHRDHAVAGRKDRNRPGGGVRTGSYASDLSAITVSFEDGTALTYRFILMGDTLLLTDEQLGNPMTLTREVEQAPQPAALDPAIF